jgi:hypothetical protein
LLTTPTPTTTWQKEKFCGDFDIHAKPAANYNKLSHGVGKYLINDLAMRKMI